MNIFSRIGASLVVLALASYSIAVLSEQRTRRVSGRAWAFLTAGVILDVTATLFMIVGSSQGALTLHGFLGYSALAGMLVDTWLIRRFRVRHAAETPVPASLHLYTRFAYLWWIAAFVTGGLLVALR
jgi:hypothetical protein